MAKNKLVVKDRGWLAMAKAAREISKGAYAKVGILADSEKGGAQVGGDLTVAELAAIHEFGTEDKKIPSRSFVRSTFDEQVEPLKKLSASLIPKILFENMPVRTALGILGAKLATEIKKKVTVGQHVPPPLQPATVEAKGSDRPLVDTGSMINATTWAVMDSGGEE